MFVLHLYLTLKFFIQSHKLNEYANCLNITLAWENAELSDLLLLYKQMVLGGLCKDNWKELSKCMNEVGWDRNNDHCRHEVNFIQK